MLTMFTGLIETTAAVLDRLETGLTVGRPPTFTDVKVGSSIAVSGVCLTVVELTDSSMRFDVVDETWSKTNLGGLRKGERVNLERALRADGRFEGHVVQGHVEGVGTVASFELRVTSVPETRNPKPETAIVRITIPPSLLPFVLPKGSITLDGVSLTVADVAGSEVTVALVPHTLRETTLGAKKTGDRVNVETDMLVRAALQSQNARM